MEHFIKYTIILLASLTSIYGFAQDPPPVIDLPTNGGTMIGEIIHANGKIFAYGADGISVFDDDNSTVTSDFDLNISLHLTKLNETTAFLVKKTESQRLNTTVAMAITITFPCWIWKVTLSERVR